MRENESLARYGAGAVNWSGQSAAAGWVQQIQSILKGWDESDFTYTNLPAPERTIAARRKAALDFVRGQFAEKFLDRLAAGDDRFFRNLAEAVRLPVGGALQPHHAALLAYVRPRIEANPKRQFTRAELRDSVKWPKGYGVPDDRQFTRLTEMLGVPMQRGAPRKSAR